MKQTNKHGKIKELRTKNDGVTFCENCVITWVVQNQIFCNKSVKFLCNRH